MGLLSYLFGAKNQTQQPPQITSIFPQAAGTKLQAGVLPTVVVDKIILGKGEICHYVDRAVLMTEKKMRKSQHVGGSYRIFSGSYLHTGDTISEPVSEPEFTKGYFYITNKRTIFVAAKNGFDKEIKKLTAVTPYSNAIDLQYGSKTYILFVPDGDVPKHVFDLLI